jgi:hypothetical protein
MEIGRWRLSACFFAFYFLLFTFYLSAWRLSNATLAAIHFRC